jgi:hypothetical protein
MARLSNGIVVGAGTGAAQPADINSDLYHSTGDGYLQFDYAAARSLDARKQLC